MEEDVIESRICRMGCICQISTGSQQRYIHICINTKTTYTLTNYLYERVLITHTQTTISRLIITEELYYYCLMP